MRMDYQLGSPLQARACPHDTESLSYTAERLQDTHRFLWERTVGLRKVVTSGA